MPGEGPSRWLGAACKARTENEVSAKTLPRVQALRRAARCMRRIGSNHHRRHSASRGNARRDGAEVSSGHGRVSVLHESGRS